MEQERPIGKPLQPKPASQPIAQDLRRLVEQAIWNIDVQRVFRDLAADRRHHAQPRLLVVGLGRKDQAGSILADLPGILCWFEIQIADVAAAGRMHEFASGPQSRSSAIGVASSQPSSGSRGVNRGTIWLSGRRGRRLSGHLLMMIL